MNKRNAILEAIAHIQDTDDLNATNTKVMTMICQFANTLFGLETQPHDWHLSAQRLNVSEFDRDNFFNPIKNSKKEREIAVFGCDQLPDILVTEDIEGCEIKLPRDAVLLLLTDICYGRIGYGISTWANSARINKNLLTPKQKAAEFLTVELRSVAEFFNDMCDGANPPIFVGKGLLAHINHKSLSMFSVV